MYKQKGREHMKTIKSIAALVLTAALLHVFVIPVNAQEAEVETSSEVVCETTGDYGQNINCRSSSQSSSRTREGIPLHEVVDTSLDANGTLLFLGTISVGLIATLAKLKTKV